MSRLRELRVHGFKSFADPTRFVFEPGVNAVIGPNGSGKSNMADAVRWVLGEQSNRSLRTRRADDVIFAGSESRRPQGMAEAVLTLDNADGWLPIEFAEVSIGRRAYRSGESEYLINGARARLRDVVELLGAGRLAANELVVVGQGTVDAALSLRPEERRQLFEEAAGVKGLQVKRNEATGRLARSRDNLARVSDLLSEIKPQVRRLALQAEHQQQHDSLVARARALVTVSHRRRERRVRSEHGEARRAAAAAEGVLAAFRERQAQGRRAVARAEERYWQADEAAREAARARETTREALIRAEGRLEIVDGRIGELRRSLEADERELADLERLLGTDDVAAVESIGEVVSRAVAAEEAWRAAVAALAQADEALLTAEQATAELRARDSDRIASAARIAEETARLDARRDRVMQDAAGVRSARAEASISVAEAAEGRSRAEASAEAARAALAAADREREAAQAEVDATHPVVVEITERLRTLRAELASLEEPIDAATRLGRRLANAGWPDLIDALDAPEASWPAIEAVVGGDLDGTLLWADGDPGASIGDARGLARLLAIDEAEIDGRGAAMAAVGADRTLADWTGGESIPVTFRRTVVAPSIEALLAGWRGLPPGWRAVTADGDLADGSGLVILRGRADPPGGAAARAHARRRELGTLIATLERELASAQEAAHAASERLRNARASHLSIREGAETDDRAARRAREDLDVAQAALARLDLRLADLEAELDGLPASPEPPAAPNDNAAELELLQRAADEARGRRDALSRARDAARDAWSATRGEAEALELQTAGRRRDRAMHEARVEHLRTTVPARWEAAAAADAERASLAESAAEARAADVDATASLERAESERAARRTEVVELDRADDGDAQQAELERAAQRATIELSRLEEALSALGRERELALDGLPEASEALPTDEIEALDDEALDTELRRVRRTLSQIGSVNPFAVEEHRELSARLDEMASQHADLVSAIDATEELIGRLDGEIGEQFDAAFRAIGEHFDAYCRLLFAGGSASLQLADDEEGESRGGIEIVVRPPGKRLQRLAMLSGGERALTGVALLFAMLTVNPVPFCILDEVDAALDEANIGRFADALRRLSESIDFVVITHNRATIEVADTIYGVTMTDAAVSRVLSLRLADVPVEVGA